MSIWGSEVETGKDITFNCEDGFLDLTQITLVSGKHAVLKIQMNGTGPFLCLARLTENRPNVQTNLYTEEDITFRVEGAPKASVSIVGNVRIHNPFDMSDDDDDEHDDGCCESGACTASRVVDLASDDGSTDGGLQTPVEPCQQPTRIAMPKSILKKPSLVEQASKTTETCGKRSISMVATEAPPSKKPRLLSPPPKLPPNESPSAKLLEQKKQQAVAKKPESKGKAEVPAQAKTTATSTAVAPGVTRTLPGGVKLEVLEVGSGKVASVGKHIKVRYEGRLAKNGKKFDGGSLDFTVGSGDMIEGFDQGCRGMMLKEKRRVFIPSRLAYKNKSVGSIPPNSDLIFDITLIASK